MSANPRCESICPSVVILAPTSPVFPPEAAPLGDAILAAVGAGFYSNPLDSIKDIVKVKETFEPNMKNHKMYSEFFDVWRSIYHNVIDDMNTHHDLLNKYNF